MAVYGRSGILCSSVSNFIVGAETVFSGDAYDDDDVAVVHFVLRRRNRPHDYVCASCPALVAMSARPHGYVCASCLALMATPARPHGYVSSPS